MTRREALKAAGCGFGYLALAGLASSEAAATLNPLAPKIPHFPPKARRAIYIFMQGGPSHVDTFEYKPLLNREDGKMLGFNDARDHRQYWPTRHFFTASDEVSVEVLSTRPEWTLGFRAVPGNGPACGRSLLHSFNANRRCGARASHVVPALRRHQFHSAVLGFLVDLWVGHGERQSAWLRHHQSFQRQWRCAQLRQRLPAPSVPGHRHRKGRITGG